MEINPLHGFSFSGTLLWFGSILKTIIDDAVTNSHLLSRQEGKA